MAGNPNARQETSFALQGEDRHDVQPLGVQDFERLLRILRESPPLADVAPSFEAPSNLADNEVTHQEVEDTPFVLLGSGQELKPDAQNVFFISRQKSTTHGQNPETVIKLNTSGLTSQVTQGYNFARDNVSTRSDVEKAIQQQVEPEADKEASYAIANEVEDISEWAIKDATAFTEFRHEMYVYFDGSPKERTAQLNAAIIRILLDDIKNDQAERLALYFEAYADTPEDKDTLLEVLTAATDPDDPRSNNIYKFAHTDDEGPSNEVRYALSKNGPDLIASLQLQNQSEASPKIQQEWTIDDSLISLASSKVKDWARVVATLTLNQPEQNGEGNTYNDAYDRFGYWLEMAEAGNEREQAMMQSYFADRYPGHIPYRFDEITELQQQLQKLTGGEVTFPDSFFADSFYHPELIKSQQHNQAILDKFYVMSCINRHGEAVVEKVPNIKDFKDFTRCYEVYRKDGARPLIKSLRILVDRAAKPSPSTNDRTGT
jgi:hypothetical protein